METNRLDIGKNKIYLEQFQNEVTVMIEDDEGYEWYICTFRKNEPVRLHTSIPRDIDIPLDKDGCAETYKEQ